MKLYNVTSNRKCNSFVFIDIFKLKEDKTMKKKPVKDELFLNWKDEAIHTYSWFKAHGISHQSIYQCLKNKLSRHS